MDGLDRTPGNPRCRRKHGCNGSHRLDGMDRTCGNRLQHGSHRTDRLDRSHGRDRSHGTDRTDRLDRLDGTAGESGDSLQHGCDGTHGTDGLHWTRRDFGRALVLSGHRGRRRAADWNDDPDAEYGHRDNGDDDPERGERCAHDAFRV